MNVPPLKPEKPQPTFGIEYKGYKIEIFDAKNLNKS